MHQGSTTRTGLLRGGAVFVLAASFTLGSSIIPVFTPEPAAAADAESMDCGMLAIGEPCSFDYHDHPGETQVTIPDNLDFVTVVMNGASGGGSTDGQGAGGLGGSVIGVIDIRLPVDRALTVWLGQEGKGLKGPSKGWSRGGRGGQSTSDGATGGGSSAISYTAQGSDEVLMVAGGGGGGGGESGSGLNDGGDGGSGGNPAQNGTRGLSGSSSVWGPGGKGGGEKGYSGGAGWDYSGDLGSGGGGGGGGFFHGGSGGENGEIAYKQLAGSGGGGGGGSSYLDDEVHEEIGYGLAPFGSGSVTIYPNQTLQRFECTDTHDPITIDIPSDVTGYAFVLQGGSGEHGHNVAPEGMGAFTTGLVDTHGLTQLDYWVGCSGYNHEGAGFGTPGAGGHAPADSNDGARGGGASALATTDGQMLVVAGGGGGTGGDEGDCDTYPGGQCGGAGGSGGGSSHSATPAHGQEGGDGVSGGGDGGCSNCHHENGHLSINGGHGVEPPSDELATGGGGGGGAGYPAGGAGGHHDDQAAGGGGGAGGSYLASSRVKSGTKAPSGVFGSGFVLLIPIVERTTELTVTATASGPAAGYAAAPFDIAAHCTLGGQTVLEHTLSLMADQAHTFGDVQQGAYCTVTETGTGGASTPAPEQAFTLGDSAKTVTMDNVFAAGDLDLSVTSAIVDGSGDPVSGTDITLGDLRAQVECSVAGHPLTLPDSGRFTVPGADTWGAGWTDTIEGLPVGAACAIRESVTGGATSVEYSADGGAPEPLPGETLIAATGSSLAVINHFVTGSVTITKAADGDGTPPPSAVYQGSATCTFGGQPVSFSPSDFSIAVGASAALSGIPVGSDCTVTETDQGDAQVVTYTPSRTIRVDSDDDTDVTVTNTFQTGAFHVQVGRTGEGSHWANSGYTVQVSCTDGTADEFSTGPEGGWRSYTPDAGATCTVTETADGGATEVTSVTSADPTPVVGPAAVAIPATGFASATVTNTFEAAPLYLDVTNSGEGAQYSDGAIIHVEACEFDGIAFDPAPDGAWTFAPGQAGGIAASEAMPVGAQCDVRIDDDAGGVPTMTPVNVDPTTVVDAATLRVTINDALLGTSVVEIDIAFALAALDVTVSNTGAGASFANVPFEAEVTCRLDDDPLHGPGGKVTLHFAPDGTLIPDPASAQLSALPVGAQCAAVETVTGGATEWGTNPPATTVESDGATLAITNVFEVATLTVTALIDGTDQAQHTGDEFVYDADCRFNGLPLTPSATTPVTFELAPNAAKQLMVPVNTECAISETHDEHATSVSPSVDQSATLTEAPAAMSFTNTFDVDEVTVEQVVSGAGADTYGMDVTYVPDLDCRWPSDGERIELPNNGKVDLDAAGFFTATVSVPVGATCGAQEPYGLASQLIAPTPITVALGGEFVLELEAIYNLGELSVQKDARGSDIAGLQFGFETHCTFPTDAGPVDIPLNDFADEAYELRGGESIALEVLHRADCTTSEVAAHDPLRVAVEATGFEAATVDRGALNVILADVPSTVLVTNYFVGSLPLTGVEMSGVLWMGLAALLIGLALVVARAIRRRRPYAGSGPSGPVR